MDSAIPKIYLPPLFSEKRIVPIFYSHFKDLLKESNLLFLDERLETYVYDFEIVETADLADIIMLPNFFKKIGKKEAEYITLQQTIADGLHKPFVLCIFGDLNHFVTWPGGTVVRNSQYKWLQRKNEIMAPAFCKDLCPSGDIVLRKKSDIPIVSFCGFAAIEGLSRNVRYHMKNLFWDMLSYGTGNLRYQAFKQGIYFRRKALRFLEASPLIESRFIIRDFFSSHQHTAKLSAEVLGREFKDSIINSDFVLTPKGDGNFSNRFFETLSAGRIPILIDTECVLPKEDMIDYSKAIIRIPFTEIDTLPERISSIYAGMTPQEFEGMQKAARRIFVDHLRYDSFFNDLFRTLAHSARVSS
jgi:hypothetical protein